LPNEAITDFVFRTRQLSVAVDPKMPDADILNHIAKYSLPDFALHCVDKKFTSFDQMILSLKQIEQQIKLKGLDSDKQEVKVQINNSNNASVIFCDLCQKRGHTRSTCWHNMRGAQSNAPFAPAFQQPRSQVRCYNCNRIGHTKRFCMAQPGAFSVPPPQAQGVRPVRPSAPYLNGHRS
jgi:hypothetical protein